MIRIVYGKLNAEFDATDAITILGSKELTGVINAVTKSLVNTVSLMVLPKLQKTIDEMKPKDLIIGELFTCKKCGSVTKETDYDNPNHYRALKEELTCEPCKRSEAVA